MNRNKKTMDGNSAAAYVSYAYSDVAAIYPITPSSAMAELTDAWSVDGKENIFGQAVKVSQMQSEAGAAGAVHGSLAAGALTTTFTASQGLLLMIPNLYKIAGELLPGVFNVAARTIASHALSIFGDHSDIYACRQTGVAMFATSSVQEVMDLTPVAHLSAIEGKLPFINFFDGFRTSHEIQKIEVWDYEDLKEMADMKLIEAFRKNALNTETAREMGSAQNPDIFFQAREACNIYYDRLPQIVEKYIGKINEKLGTNYGLFNYYGAEDADNIIIAMGSVCETIEETIDYLNAAGGKYGLVKVHLYRPFSVEHLIKVIPDTVKKITVLDRTKEPGSVGEPLYIDIVAALKDSKFENVPVYSGRYGLSSKDTTPSQINAIYKNKDKKRFTVGIVDDVTHLSLDIEEEINTAPKGTICCKFWGLGADGTISANKNSIKIIGNHTDMNVQAYFSYDSKKSGGVTGSHLRFGKEKIKSAYLVNQADFVACHNQTYIHKYDMISELKPGGIFLLNCTWNQEELEYKIPRYVKNYIADNNINFYTIDALKIGKEIGINSKYNTVLQSAFFKLAGIIPYEDAVVHMKEAARNSYGIKGDNIVKMNYEAIDRGASGLVKVEIPKEWGSSYNEAEQDGFNNILNNMYGNSASSDKNATDEDKKLMYLNTQNAYGVLKNSGEVSGDDGSNEASCGSSCHASSGFGGSLQDLKEASWANPAACGASKEEFVEKIQRVVNAQKGDLLPVSAFMPYVDGSTPSGTAAYEKRDIAVDIPEWIPENCIQCNRCSFVCPHAVIRPTVLNEEESKNAPEKMQKLKMMGMENLEFGITISARDCTGCGACVGICPGMRGNKALIMKPATEEDKEMKQKIFNYGKDLIPKKEVVEKFAPTTVKGSQFKRPLMEFSGACAGCGETPYIKLLTQLFGERMYIANATGCTSIWGNSSPSTPYTTDSNGRGPAWSNSLFEDAAEFGYGMLLAQNSIRERLKSKVIKLSELTENEELKDSAKKWLETYNQGALNGEATEKLVEVLEKESNKGISINTQVADGNSINKDSDSEINNSQVNIQEDVHRVEAYNRAENTAGQLSADHIISELLTEKKFLSKKSQWIFGGDGWAYDIGFGGLDHVLASGQDINILILDTEVYSNTGGQSSKATPSGAIAKFSTGGKDIKKKNLAKMMMSYGYVYVAQVSLGADFNQTMKAFTEAESYNGPSVIIAYAPCISHGIRAGMGCSAAEEAKAVKTGYWNMFRYNPMLESEGKNGLIIDGPAPSEDYKDFLSGEIRFDALNKTNPKKAEILAARGAWEAKKRYEQLKKDSGN